MAVAPCQSARRCSFCQHRNATGGVERAAQTRVFDDLRWLVETGTARINLVDPTFNSTNAHAVTTLDALSAFCATSGASPVVTLRTRPEKINKSFLDAIERCSAKVVLECGVHIKCTPLPARTVVRRMTAASSASWHSAAAARHRAAD